MGLLDRVPGFGGGDDDGLDDIDFDEVEPEPEEGEEIDPDPEPEPEPEPQQEWDSAYDFAGDVLEPQGFVSMKEFGDKVMMREIQKSPMYRDRLKNGMETLNALRDAKDSMDDLRGSDNSQPDLKEQAERIQAANEVINGVKTLSGEEEAWMRDIVRLGQDAVDAVATRATGGANVETGMEVSEEEL